MLILSPVPAQGHIKSPISSFRRLMGKKKKKKKPPLCIALVSGGKHSFFTGDSFRDDALCKGILWLGEFLCCVFCCLASESCCFILREDLNRFPFPVFKSPSAVQSASRDASKRITLSENDTSQWDPPSYFYDSSLVQRKWPFLEPTH